MLFCSSTDIRAVCDGLWVDSEVLWSCTVPLASLDHGFEHVYVLFGH
jgi:hypothetical protein